MKASPLKVVNRALAPMNLKVDSVRTRAWDRHFDRWIAEAKTKGVDPNDLGDVAWGDDALERGLKDFYLPRVAPDATAVELGPGSGRLTRHLVGQMQYVTVVDFSSAVTKWLTAYLDGRGANDIRLISEPGLPWMAEDSVDVAFAHGVVEHFDQEVLVAFLVDLARVLKPGGEFVFTFNDLSSPSSKPLLLAERGEVRANRFRFYEPTAIKRLGEMFEFDVDLTVTGERISFAVFKKQAS